MGFFYLKRQLEKYVCKGKKNVLCLVFTPCIGYIKRVTTGFLHLPPVFSALRTVGAKLQKPIKHLINEHKREQVPATPNSDLHLLSLVPNSPHFASNLHFFGFRCSSTTKPITWGSVLLEFWALLLHLVGTSENQ